MARTQTDQRGFFTFSEMPEGDYRYAVMDAPAWVFPSMPVPDYAGYGPHGDGGRVGQRLQPRGRRALSSPTFRWIRITARRWRSDKAADLDSVGHGEFVTYTLSFTNNMHQALIGGEILDRPAYGVNFVPGSVTLER